MLLRVGSTGGVKPVLYCQKNISRVFNLYHTEFKKLLGMEIFRQRHELIGKVDAENKIAAII